MVRDELYRVFVLFKQKTAYEMRISDWSSDVCSSDLSGAGGLLSHPASSSTLPESAAASMALTAAFLRMGIAIPFSPWGPFTWTLGPRGSTCLQIGRASCRERVCQYV